MNEEELEKRIKKYSMNGMKENIAILRAKVEYIHDDVQLMKNKLGIISSVKTRSNINTTLIIVIITALVGLSFKVF